MTATPRLLVSSALLSLITLASGCVIHERGGEAAREEGYREGYYDRDQHRYWHEHTWHECREHDEYCR